MDVRILGPLELAVDGRVLRLPRRRQQALIAILALHAGKVVSTDRLIDDIWGERPPRRAREALHNAVAQVRRLIGADVLLWRAPGYMLDVAPEQVDLGRFEQLRVQAGETGDAATRAAKLREALGLWRGPPLAGLEFEPFAQFELPPLNEAHLAAREDLIDAELALGQHANLIAEIDGLVVEHPFDERLRRQLMLALYRAGRQADALDASRQARRALVDTHGLEPSVELRQLEHDILHQDPGIAVPSTELLSAPPARKTVTVVFAGLVDAAGESDERDPEALRVLLDRYLESMQATVHRHGGTVHELVGHAALAIFGIPTAHEDDALRALRAAVEMRDAIGGLDPELDLRIGVNTGEVYTPDPTAGRVIVTGQPVQIGRRIEQAAQPGEILLGPATLRLVRAAVVAEAAESIAVGAEQERPVFRLLELTAGASGLERHLDAAFVDRVSELAALRQAFESVIADERSRVVTILGDAGIGKTKLAAELAARLPNEAAILVGHCPSYGEGATYLPLEEVVRSAGGDLQVLLTGAASTGEEFLAVRRYFESLARTRPVVVVLDDLQWAEPTFLDLIEYLADQLSGVPVLIVCLARPELLEVRGGWREPLRLAPLQPDETQELLERLAGDTEPALRAHISERAEGNPLFAEQLLAYVGEGGELESMPPTLDALLASRLDRLPTDARLLLQSASVVGLEFGPEALQELAVGEVAASVEQELQGLAEQGLLVRPTGDEFRFQHVLIRDAAYAGLPKARRADLHESLAAWLAVQPVGSDELVGYHLEQAYHYRIEVAPPDERSRKLADEAGKRLGAAGIRAWRRGDTPAAVNLLRRAVDVLQELDSFRLEIMPELGVALRGAGELRMAEEVLADAVTAAATAGNRRAHLRALLELANARMFSNSSGTSDDVVEAAGEAIPYFEAQGDERGLSRAWRLMAFVEGAMKCEFLASSVAAERALDHCRRSSWSTAACLGDLAAALYYGPTPVPEAIERCRELLEGADMGGEANVLMHLGGLEAMRGRFDEARTLVIRGRMMYEELGQSAVAHSFGGGVAGQIELLDGNPIAAEQSFRASCEALESIGDRAYLATRATQLAEALYLTDRIDEAARWSQLAEESAAPDDIPTQFLWRSIRSKLLARDGKSSEAVTLAREARRLAERTDALNHRARVLLDQAEVMRLCARHRDSRATTERALALFDLKGNTVAAAQVRTFLGQE